MLEACMIGSGVHLMGVAELFQSLQSLVLYRIDNNSRKWDKLKYFQIKSK